MRVIALVGVALVVIACGEERTADAAPLPGQPGWTSSSGEVSLTDGESLSFEITSERYKAWDAARQGIDSRISARYGAILQPGSPSRRNIERAVRYLESEPAAVASIRNAGMSVRDFVVTTVALEEEMRLATARGQLPPDTILPPPYPTYSTYPPDTTSFMTYQPIPLPQPTAVVPSYLDTFPRRDTLPARDSFVITRTDTSTRRFPIADSIARTAARRDSLAFRTAPRDSILIRRDTIRRDTVRRDTVIRRDSLPPAPSALPDTIPAISGRR